MAMEFKTLNKTKNHNKG